MDVPDDFWVVDVHEFGAAARFQAAGLDVCVTRVEHRRVMEIRVRPLPPEKEEREKAHAHSGT